MTIDLTPEQSEVGPNGYRVGYNEDGDWVEWVPDDDNPGEFLPLMLRRNDQAMWEAYKEFGEKVWWTVHGDLLCRIPTSEISMAEEQKPIFERTKEAARRIEDKYGRENLTWSDFEFGLVTGRMSALAWVFGAEWKQSLDIRNMV